MRPLHNYQYILNEKSMKQKLKLPCIGKNMEKPEPSYTPGWHVKF